MAKINVSSVQQYTIDRLRVSFLTSYDVELIGQMDYRILKADGSDVTNHFKSIADSNDWQYIADSQTFDLYLNDHTCIEEGTYTFILIFRGEECYRTDIKLRYMEDIRVEFSKVEFPTSDIAKIYMKPLDEDNPEYQTREMMDLMNFSIIESTSGIFYSDTFKPMAYTMNGNCVESFTISLRQGTSFPKGYYDIRLTSRYKNRTFSIVEKMNVAFPFMTTSPAKISSAYIAKKASGDTCLTVIFDPYLEKGLLNDGARLVVRDRDGKNITNQFDADRISTTSYTVTNIQYITRIDIPLLTDFYALEKGLYTIGWYWEDERVEDISTTIHVNWVVTGAEKVTVFEDKFIDFDLNQAEYISEFLEKEKYLVELNGNTIDPSTLFGDLDSVANLKDIDVPERTDHFGIPIKDIGSIEDGNYTFIFYHMDDINEPIYDYMGTIDISAALTPIVTEVYQSNIDAITVALKNPQPISVLESCVPVLKDHYGNIDFSSRLGTIQDSNIWEPGQTTADRFDIYIQDSSNIQSGEYAFNMIYRGHTLESHSVNLKYMESRKGFIKSVKQISISEIKITFSEPQSRQFLLSTVFDVERKIDGANFTDRFEYLENVLKAEYSSFTEIVIPMDHEDSFPAGRYRISFLYKNAHDISQVIYGFDAELGYMTNNIPSIKSVTYANMNGRTELNVVFENPLQQDLFNLADVSIIRKADTVDCADAFEDKDQWKTITTSTRGIRSIKSIMIPMRDPEDTILERGNYEVIFSWAGVIKYLDDLKGSVFLEYNLPSIKHSEVVALDPTNGTGRIYFELDQPMQYHYFADLKVEVIDPYGHNATAYFSTIQNSNNFDPNTSTNNYNLNIIDTNEIEFGQYQFIFYHVIAGIRTSDNMAKLDITTALSPRIAIAEQKAINKIEITFRNSIPRRLLEEFTFTFVGMDKTDYTEWFMSIDQANDWPEDLREVTSFYIELKGGYAIEQGTYLFTMFNGNLECDGYLFDIYHLEGCSGQIASTKPLSLSKLEVIFANEEPLKLFETLDMIVLDSNGTDVSNQFSDLQSALGEVDADFFDTIALDILGTVPAGIYTFIFQKDYTGTLDVVYENPAAIPYMSATYPLLYEVSATKIGDTMDGDDGLVMWFSPPLEKALFENAKFGILNANNTDINYTSKFKPITSAILDTTEVDGVEYIDYATLEFANKETLNRNDYLIRYEWDGEYDYMKNLEREIRLDYILFPMKEIIQTDIDTLTMYFKSAVSGKKMKQSELFVSTIYSGENEDGSVITEVDFSDQFLPLNTANTIEEGDSVLSLLAKLGTRNPDHPAELILPPGSYRFIIAEEVEVNDGVGLQYAYAGTCKISLMFNSDVLNASATVKQVSYDSLQFDFSRSQLTDMLNDFKFVLYRNDPVTGDRIDYANMFKGIRESNFYSRVGNNNAIEKGYYEYVVDNDIVINDIHYVLKETDRIFSRIDAGKAIPSHTYKTGWVYNNREYFLSDITVPFMTAEPPAIAYAEIVDGQLRICFSPCAELEALKASSYSIMTNRGKNALGEIRGEDVSHNFGSILNATMVEDPKGEFTYVSEIRLDINENAFLASGKYTITWNWPESSWFPTSVYTGGLSVVGKGVKSARTISKNTIEIKLDDSYLAKDVKALTLGVATSSGTDVTEYFMSMEESNADIDDASTTDTYYVKVDDGEDVTSDIYSFTLSQDFEEDDENGESVTIKNTMLAWSMNIVYMASDFPEIIRVDNMSVEKFEIFEITNNNSNRFIGKKGQLISSNDPDEIMDITSENIANFIGHWVRIYGTPDITRMTIEFDEEIEGCLVDALEMELIDADGNIVSDKFRAIMDCNEVQSRKVLQAILFKFPKFYDGETLEKFDINIETADGRDLTNQFKSVNRSNNYLDESNYKNLNLEVDTDEVIEEYDLKDLKITIEDDEGEYITNFTYDFRYQTIETTRFVDVEIERETTILPDEYTIRLSYTNEPDIPDSVTITPFTYTGELPFLSNNLGVIDSIACNDLESFDITFSNPDLPSIVFQFAEMRILSSEGEEVDVEYEDLWVTNGFDDLATVGELTTPRVVHVQLEEGQTITAGEYTVEFWIDLASFDSDPEIEDDDDEDDENDNVNSGEYRLWEASVSFPYLFREQVNSITSVEICGIDTLKINLEKPLDAGLLRTFTVDLYSSDKNSIYTDLFRSIEESNFFGLYLMPTDQQFVLYSVDGNSWGRYNTGLSYNFTKAFYHKGSGKAFALCSNGKIVCMPDIMDAPLGKTAAESISYGTSENTVNTSLNDYYIMDDMIVIVGNNGVILKGTITSSGKLSLKKITSGTVNTLSSITRVGETNILVAVGYRGTVLKSTDLGSTWTVIATGLTNNLTDVYYHSNTLTFEEEEGEVEEDEESGEVISEPTVTTRTMATSTLFITGTNGLILQTDDIDAGFERMDTKTPKSIFAITSKDDKIVAVGDTGLIITIDDTEDGFELSLVNSNVSFAIRDIVYAESKFYACCANGKWLVSSSGNKWSVKSSSYATSLKSVSYAPSQYPNNMGDYFYIKLRDNTEIGAVNFYSGYDIPTLGSSFCSTWNTNDQKDRHIGDFYTQFENIGYKQTPVKWYQFRKYSEISVNDEDETDVSQTIEYGWYECSEFDKPRNGDYFIRLRQTAESDTDAWMYSTPTKVTLPYMTSNPGEIESVVIHSPDDRPGIEFQDPYLQVNFDRGNENAFEYAMYEFIGPDGKDYTNAFKSMRVGTKEFNSGFYLSDIVIYGNPDVIYSLPAGIYTLKWTWMALAPSNVITIPDIRVKTMKRLMTVDVVTGKAGKLLGTLNHDLSVGFFSDGGISSGGFSATIRRLPNTEKELGQDTNYFNYFMPIDSVTDFSDPTYGSGGKAKKFSLEVREDIVMNSGEYVMKISNDNPTYSVEKDNDNEMWISATRISLKTEVTKIIPSLSNVTFNRHAVTPTPIVDNRIAESYSGTGSPMENKSIITMTNNWRLSTDMADLHVGDSYLDVNTYEYWYFIKDARTGNHRWDRLSEKLYLIVTFGQLPSYNAFISGYHSFTLIEGSTHLESLFKQSLLDWEFDTRVSNGIRYITKAYIPLDDLAEFPGTENATFTMKFKPDSTYEDLTIENLRFLKSLKSYGKISYITPFNPRPTYVGGERIDDERAGFIVHFDRVLSKSFLQSLSFIIYKQFDDGETENVTQAFSGVVESNADFFWDTNTDRTDSIELVLRTGTYIDHGLYVIKLVGEREADDLNTDENGDSTIPYVGSVDTPWLSTYLPEKMTTELTYGSGNPVLTIKFPDVQPPASSILVHYGGKGNGKFKVVRHDGDQGDYTKIFRSLKHPSTVFTVHEEEGSIEEYVDSIAITMKDNTAIPKGVYNTFFYFSTWSLIDSTLFMNGADSGGCSQFTAKTIGVGKIGTFKSASCKGKKMTLKIKKNSGVNTNAKLAKSQIGQVLKITTWKQLIGKMKLSMIKSKKEYRSYFETASKKRKITNNAMVLQIKKNKKIKPGKFKFSMTYGGCSPLRAKTLQIQGLILNSVGKASKDPTAWILHENNAGKKHCRVYKSYKYANNRVKKLQRLNTIAKYQSMLCKMCRSINLLSTTKIKACIDAYDFPYQYKKGIALFFKRLVKKWYRYRTSPKKKVGSSLEEYMVRISLEPGKMFDSKGKIVDDKENPTKVHYYKCGKKPFAGFKFHQTVDKGGSENHVSYSCSHYTNSSTPWKWSWDIATVKKGNFPSKSRSKMYFATITWKGIELSRGYKSTKKGKKSSAFKKYYKWLTKKVKNRKKAIAKCKACKKRALAEKSGKKIGWNAALFPWRVGALKRMKPLPKLLNISQKKGGYKGKKKNMGCIKPNFKWVQVTVKKVKYAKLKCKNAKPADKTLKNSSFQAIYYKK